MDLQVINNQIAGQIGQVSQEIQSTANSQVLNNPEQMLQAQFALTQYQLLVGYDSAVIGAYKNMIQGIISKI